MVIYKLKTGDEVHDYEKSIVVQFNGEREVLSTGPINGGHRKDLKFAFNHDANPGAGMKCALRAPTYEEHMYLIAGELGLDPEKTTGISTAASMRNVSIVEESYRDITVTAIVTGGIETNGGRVGDPASNYEEQGKFQDVKNGTINIILVIDADLTSGALTRSLVTCTEGKTAAIQELMEGSKYSRGIATGSGTDGTIIICNSESKIKLTSAGKHSKLGELIGIAVKKSVKEALFFQSGLCPQYQHSLLRRIKRFGVNENLIWQKYIDIKENLEDILGKPEFINNLHRIDKEDKIVTLTSLYVHLLDQLDWELLSIEEVENEGKNILSRIMEESIISDVAYELEIHNKDKTIDGTVSFMVDKFVETIAIISGKIVFE